MPLSTPIIAIIATVVTGIGASYVTARIARYTADKQRTTGIESSRITELNAIRESHDKCLEREHEAINDRTRIEQEFRAELRKAWEDCEKDKFALRSQVVQSRAETDMLAEMLRDIKAGRDPLNVTDAQILRLIERKEET